MSWPLSQIHLKIYRHLGPQFHNLQAVDEVEFQGLKFVFHGDRFVFLVSVLCLSVSVLCLSET